MRPPVPLRAPLWASLVVGLGSLLGCASDAPSPDGAETTPLQDQEVQAQEPVQGVPDAPPFGAPREKLSPGEHVAPDED